MVALKLVTLLLFVNVVPPTDVVVSKAPEIMAAPVSLMVPVEVKMTLLLAPATMLPLMLIAPVLSILTLPVPD